MSSRVASGQLGATALTLRSIVPPGQETDTVVDSMTDENVPPIESIGPPI